MIELPNARSRAQWVERIAEAWRASVAAIIETGRLLNEAKDELAHGEWLAMIENDLPFGPRTAQRLMAIAGDERLTNPTHVSHLPPSWGTLYELSKLDDAAFESGVSDGTIHAGMTRGEVAVVRGTFGTGEFERYTPTRYIEAVREALGDIDLDPATCCAAQEVVRAKTFFTVETDGLARPWHGRVFLNPPYHRDLMSRFVAKLVDEISAGRVTAAIMLTNNTTDTIWFDAALRACASLCFTRGRIRFVDPHGGELGQPTQGQMFLYFGPDVARFERVFRGAVGLCARPSLEPAGPALTPRSR
jgi:hypothetical protein